MKTSFVELCDLGNQMEVFKWDVVRQLGAVEMGIAEQPQLMDEGVDLMYDVLDSGEGLIFVVGSIDSLYVSVLQRDPLGNNVTKEQ
jgi:hypothetical protein